VKKKMVDLAEKIVMDRHERRRQKLLKNRNKEMGMEENTAPRNEE